MKIYFLPIGLLLLASISVHAVVVDGSLADDDYGDALAVQTNGTQFGDNFSELNAAYGQLSGNSLFLMFTGNLENNFNKFTLFIDSKAGGQNVIDRDSNANNDNWAQFFDGFQFDDGFDPDYLLFVRHGTSQGQAVLEVDYVVIGEQIGDKAGSFPYKNPPSTGPFTSANGIVLGFDNTNTGGITDGSADANEALAVQTGIEIEIPLALLGDPSADIKVMALVNGANHDFVSNQFLAGLPEGSGNLGTDGNGGFVANSSLTINLNDFDGDQFFEVPFDLPAVDPAFVSGVSASVNAFEVFVRDTATSSLDPASIALTVTGVSGTVRNSLADGLTIVTFEPETLFAPGSTHQYSFTASDASGNEIKRSGTFSLPELLLPTGGIPGPEGSAGFWALRQIWDADELLEDGLQSLRDAVLVAEAADAADFAGQVSDAQVETLDFGSGGIFYNNRSYPAQADPVLGMPEDDFVIVAKGFVSIPRAGDWTFGVHSDDGFALRLVGAEFDSVHGGGQLDTLDASVIGFASGTADSNTRGIVRGLAAGIYPIEVITWDGGGGDLLEIYAAEGAFALDSETTSWRLIGEVPLQESYLLPGVDESGWTVKTSAPGGETLNAIDQALAEAEAVTETTNADFINFNDPESDGANSGSIGGDTPFPGNTADGDDHFALLAEANLEIVTSGTYWLGFQGDDGGFLEVVDQNFTSIVQDATGGASLEGSRISCDCLTGNSRTVGEITLEAGTYRIRVLWLEAGINANFEVFGAEAGSTELPLIAKGGAGTMAAIGGLALQSEGGGERITITSISRSAQSVALSWIAEEGSFYDIERSTDLAPGSWAMLASNFPEGGASAGVLTFTDANATDSRAFYRVAAGSSPPYLTTGFEAGAEGWTAGVNAGDSGATEWQVGMPTSGPGAAYAGANAFGTNIAADYGNDARITLRSPVIDLTNATKPTLEFWFFLDADAAEGGQVNLLAEDGSEIRQQLFLFTGELSGSNWRRAITRLPGAVIGQRIIVEFEFLSDDSEPNGAGWFIDEVTVRE